MIRVLMLDSAFSAAPSRRFSSASMSSGLIWSGSNLIWNEALAGQISVTPFILLSFTAVVMDRLLKKASNDISSSTSTKMCSSPPKEYRVFIAPPPLRPSLRGQLGRVAFEPAFQPARVELRLRDRRIGSQRQMQGLRGLDAADLQLAERAGQARDRRFPALVPDDQLAEQRVIERRDRAAGIEQRIEPYAVAAGDPQRIDRTGSGHEVLRRVFGVDADLDGMAADRDLALLQAQLLAAGDLQHLAHQIDAGDDLRH